MLSLREFYPEHMGYGCVTKEGFYLFIPKCASTSIKKTAIGENSHIQQHEDKFKYTYIRNPYTRAVSSYCECKVRNKAIDMPFRYFLKHIEDIQDVHVYPQSDFIDGFKLDQIRVLEHWVLEHHERKSKNKDMILNEVMFDREIRYLIEKIYYKDIELYERNIYNRVS